MEMVKSKRLKQKYMTRIRRIYHRNWVTQGEMNETNDERFLQRYETD